MTLDELARRAVACPRWRWMPGMAFFDEHGAQWRVQSETHATYVHDDRVPDLTDPATLGCLIALVREARGESTGFLAPAKGGGWRYWTRLYPADYFHGDTEAEALVIALEAAP